MIHVNVTKYFLCLYELVKQQLVKLASDTNNKDTTKANHYYCESDCLIAKQEEIKVLIQIIVEFRT